jgi:hypothetical protein
MTAAGLLGLRPGFMARVYGALGVGGIVIAQPLLNFFPLSGEDDALPFHYAGSLTVFGHNIGALVEHLDQAIRLGAFKVIRRERGMMLLHALPG